MQDRWYHNDILIYSTQNKGKSVAAVRFIKTFKEKIYESSTTYDSKSYLSYLNKLVDEYNDSYHCNKSS